MTFLFLSIGLVWTAALALGLHLVREYRSSRILSPYETTPCTCSATELAERFAREKHIYAQMSIYLYKPIMRRIKTLNGYAESLRSLPKRERKLYPAAEWIADNSGVLVEELRNCARSFARVKLPCDEGIPRILLLAWLLTVKYASPLETDTVERAVQAYCRQEELTDTELWMLPSAIRLCCCLKAERIAAATVNACRTHEPLSPEEALQMREQAAFAVTALHTMRLADWESVCTRLSTPEKIYATEACDVYAHMDKESRAYCRRRTAALAQKSRHSERQVAETAVAVADERRADVCEVLFGRYENDLRIRLGLHAKRTSHASAWYLTGVAVFWVATVLLITAPFFSYGFWTWLSVAGLVGIVASEIAVRLLNALLTRLVPPRFLPKIQVRELNADSSTVVIVPFIMPNAEAARHAAEKLEMYYLTNCLTGIRFVLLGDYADADKPCLPADDEVKAEASRCIRELCARYGDVFFYFQRARRYHAGDKVYTAWERKRGALI